MSLLYCGNNRNNPDLLNGLARIGTRYECLKKGIGVGLNLPYDPVYDLPYNPIDRAKVYCGTRRRVPQGYTRMGSPAACFRKGVGTGRKLKANKEKEKSKKPRKSPRKSRRRRSRRRSRRSRRKK